jgi:hypothetical protein
MEARPRDACQETPEEPGTSLELSTLKSVKTQLENCLEGRTRWDLKRKKRARGSAR